MSLINCPECGKEISDKATTCIYCGGSLQKAEETEENICKECGNILTKDEKICTKCGCPIENVEDKAQKVKITGISINKKILISTCIIIVSLIICVIGYNMIKSNYEKKQAAEEKKLYEESFDKYIDNLELVQMTMYSGGADAESLCNLTLTVWGNSINEIKDNKTDKYTRKEEGLGWFNDDFNISLGNLFNDSEVIDSISEIESNQDTVKDIMKDLQNIPDGLENCYDTVTELYSAYQGLTDLAINPTGNYSNFGNSKSDKVDEFIKYSEKLTTQIPDRYETKSTEENQTSTSDKYKGVEEATSNVE